MCTMFAICNHRRVVTYSVPAMRHMEVKSRTTMLLVPILTQMSMVNLRTVTWLRIMTATSSTVL